MESDRGVYSHPPSSTNFCKYGLAEEEEELAKLVERLDKAATAYGKEISADKTKQMTNNTNGVNKEIKVNKQRLEKSKASSALALL